jgi:hypothetical protein
MRAPRTTGLPPPCRGDDSGRESTGRAFSGAQSGQPTVSNVLVVFKCDLIHMRAARRKTRETGPLSPRAALSLRAHLHQELLGLRVGWIERHQLFGPRHCQKPAAALGIEDGERVDDCAVG